MKKNTYIALGIAAFFLMVIFGLGIYADKQFKKSGQHIELGIEFKSDKVEQLEREKNYIIEKLSAVNEDLTKQSVANHRIQKQADSVKSAQDRIIYNLRIQKKRDNEEIDSLRAVIRSIRQSDI